MAKSYPLDVQPLREYQGNQFGWWSKGLHAAEDFLYALQETWGEQPEPTEPLIREHWRVIPSTDPGNPGYCTQARPGTRGAFPVTVLYT